MKSWITHNAPWLGFIVMALAGAVVAHIRAFERSSTPMQLRDHVKGLLIRSVYAGMAGLMIYLIFEAAITYGYKVSEPLAFVAAGIGGMFGAELFDFIFTTGKDWIRKRLGLTPSPPQASPLPVAPPSDLPR